MKTRLAAIAVAAVLAVTLSGCGDDETPAAEPAPAAASAQDQRTTDAAESTPVPAELTPEDEGFLAEVQDRTRPGTVLGEFTDAELIEFGHEGCEQIGEGVPIEDLRLVEGEKADAGGYFMDSSAVFNSALLNYCPELLEDID